MRSRTHRMQDTLRWASCVGRRKKGRSKWSRICDGLSFFGARSASYRWRTRGGESTNPNPRSIPNPNPNPIISSRYNCSYNYRYNYLLGVRYNYNCTTYNPKTIRGLERSPGVTFQPVRGRAPTSFAKRNPKTIIIVRCTIT